jgi:hypothetical protein
VAAAIASLELFILIVIGVAFIGKLTADEVKRATTPIVAQSATSEPAGQKAAPAKAKTVAAPVLRPRNETSVIVLNGNGIQGAASVAADRVRSKHYIIAGTGNAPRRDFAHSVVMYRPGFKEEAQRLAGDLGVKRVAPLDGLRVRDLQGAHLAFVIGG